MSFAPAAGVPPDAAECWWLECDARPLTPDGCFTDRHGMPIRKWQSHLTSYGRKWRANQASRTNYRGRLPGPSRAIAPVYDMNDTRL